VIPPNGYGEDRPYSLEEIMAVLHNIYLYFKNIGDYKTRFIPKSLAQLFVNTNPNSKSFEESMFLKLLHHPIIPDTLGGKKSIQKHVSQEVYDNYRFTLFHDINAEEQSTLWFMIGKVYWMYKAVTKDLHRYYKNHDNWQMIFGSFETFVSYHIDFIKQTYGHVDIHVGFLAVDKKVWQRFTEAMEVDFQIIMYPTDQQRTQLENDRYVRYVEKQGLSPDNFDDDFRSRESRIDHDRNKIIDLQTKRAERALGNR
jgi:archaellum component FlaG (FlaF/FlaG flagellin family)